MEVLTMNNLREVNDDILKEAIENLGYTVLEIIC